MIGYKYYFHDEYTPLLYTIPHSLTYQRVTTWSTARFLQILRKKVKLLGLGVRMSCDDSHAELEGHLLETLPEFDMAGIYASVLVDVAVGNDVTGRKKFTVPREQVCGYSTTLSNALKKSFIEASEKSFRLPDHRPAAFAVFLNFITMFRISLSWDTIPQAPDQSDSTSWTWMFLFECYVLADYLGAQMFRDRVFEAIQLKYICDDVNAHLPSPADVEYVYNELPETSQLRKLVIKSHIDLNVPNSFSDDPYSSEFLTDCLVQMKRENSALRCIHCTFSSTGATANVCESTLHDTLDKHRDPVDTWCFFHEHHSEEEAQMCQWRLRAMMDRLRTAMIGWPKTSSKHPAQFDLED